MANATETCCCGARIETASQSGLAVGSRLGEFRTAHAPCREAFAREMAGRRARDAMSLGQSLWTTSHDGGRW